MYLLIEKHFTFLMEATTSFLQFNENESPAYSGKG